MRRRPDWWQWDFAVSWHVLNRMEERGFTFSDIMYMLNRTTRVVDDTLPGRFRAFTRWRNNPWIVILEPDPATRTVVIVTAFPTN